MKALVRNKKNDKIKHARIFKLKSSKISNTYEYEIPIMFDKIIDGYDSNNNEIYHFTWKVYPEIYKIVPKRKINELIKQKESEFIDKVLNVAGNDMIEYWELDPVKDHSRISELDRKYYRYKI